MSLPRLSSFNHPLSKIFNLIDSLVLQLSFPSTGRGRPKKFSDLQLIKCLVYQVFYRIRSFRELEWKLKQDYWAMRAIGLTEVPDYSTFCRRAKRIENRLYFKLYQLIIDKLCPDTRICIIDSTSLRASRYDRQARKGKNTRLGWFYGYKLHMICSIDLIPLVWQLSHAACYDNQFGHLIQFLRNYDVFYLLADAAYDDHRLFALCHEHGFHLVTQVNFRNASSPDSFRQFCRWQNWYFTTHGIGKKLLPLRLVIERFFSTLKTTYGLEQPRFYGMNRYYRHVLWVMLVYLLDCLINKSHGLNTRKAPWNR
jgi:transposase